MSLVFFLSGIGMATFVFSGILFFKFWKVSSDKFFLYFCLACVLLAVERGVILSLTYQYVAPRQAEVSIWVYTLRLFAFGLILAAVVNKNRASKKP